MADTPQDTITKTQQHEIFPPSGVAISLTLTGLLVGSLIVGAVDSPRASIAANSAQSINNHEETRSHGFADLVKSARPATVNITATKVMTNWQPPDIQQEGRDWFNQGPRDRNFFGIPGRPRQPQKPFGQGVGSGVVVSPDGYVVTNHHVVDGANKLTVTLIDKREFDGTLIGSDPQTDLAVIKIKGKDLPYIPWGDSSKLEVGEYVLAIGNPFGLNSTVTQGIVSALGREGMGITKYEDFIQTDAAINPGNSGGALVNMRGELVGINTAILSKNGGYQGVGFAIPANMGKHIYESVIKTGTVQRGFLGVSIQEISKNLALSLRLPNTSGALVTNVQNNSPAEKAGIKRGDTIISFEGQKISSPRSLQRTVTRTKVGSEVTLRIIRNGETVTLGTTLSEHPDTRKIASFNTPSKTTKLYGLMVEEINPQMARQFQLNTDTSGVVVTAIQPGSSADSAGLEQGDVISEVNRQPVRNLNDYKSAISNLSYERPALLLVHRQGVPIFMTLKV